MQIAIPIYPDFTALDAVGPYDVLCRMPGASVVFCSAEAGPITTETGMLTILAERSLAEVPSPDVVVVPGGYGNRGLLDADSPYVRWLQDVHPQTQWTTSVCTGALLLAAAGLLDGLEATTHWLARDALGDLGATPVAERVVAHPGQRIVTAAGVSAGIDMALSLVARIHGDTAAQAIQLGIEYDPQPPFDTGSPEKAPAELVAAVRASEMPQTSEMPDG